MKVRQASEREGGKEDNPGTFCSSAVNTYIVIIM